MKSLHIRDVPEETVRRLKRLARLHHRSLQGELQAILERAARLAPLSEESSELDLNTVDTGGTSTWSREEIYGTDCR